ncbi:MAG: EscU/YscU/HrcU family type III secretion system export apparatus switch protein, partial [Clostridiaceae bacterium]|nr:EscU/YscU/HrcU family type III secretion system export apparatus switch protein [Clostridiaceae bacterium]
QYDVEKDSVPKITASGQGTVAENIVQKAQDHNVNIYEDERLVKELLQFKVGTEIPPELYEIVAQILVFVESVDQEKTGKIALEK